LSAVTLFALALRATLVSILVTRALALGAVLVAIRIARALASGAVLIAITRSLAARAFLIAIRLALVLTAWALLIWSLLALALASGAFRSALVPLSLLALTLAGCLAPVLAALPRLLTLVAAATVWFLLGAAASLHGSPASGFRCSLCRREQSSDE